MKQISEKKANSAVVIAAVTALTLITANAVRKGGLAGILNQNKQGGRDSLPGIDSHIESILAENASLRKNIELMSSYLDKMAIQNEKLMKSNIELTAALKEEQDRVMVLMNIVTKENEEKLSLTQKLEEATNKLSVGSGRAETADVPNSKEYIA